MVLFITVRYDYVYYREDIVEGEGVECSCMYAESPGEFYVRPVHLKIKLERSVNICPI